MIPIIGKCFPTVALFLDYLEGIQFGPWHPNYVVMHHTGAPDGPTWAGWQTRKVPVTDEQWMRNLQGYYTGLGWSRAPHFFFTPKNYCVLSLPTVRGTHAVSFNANSWGVECVGDFDREQFGGAIADRYADGLAALHLAAGLRPGGFAQARSGLHFHRDDPKTSKTCPGKHVQKGPLIQIIERKMAGMSQGDHPDERVIAPVDVAAHRKGVIANVPVGETLNVRGAASAKAPVLAKLRNGDAVEIVGEGRNGETLWLRLDIVGDTDGWVAARYVKIEGAA